MKKISILLFTFILFAGNIFAQSKNNYFDFSKRGEAYFSFKTEDKDVIRQLSKIISIDKIEDEGIIAYANEQEFNKFLEFGIEPTILTPPSMLEEHIMFTLEDYNSKAVNEWDSYPTYEAYIAMMNDFGTNFPNLCQTIEFGTTFNSRKLMMCKLTSNLNPNTKAKVHLSSTMHGDEVTGYVLMLRLIDYLLNNYATNPRIKNILDNAEVWICPNANPDGTYKTGNSNVNGATRANGNNVDLNRNYKDDVNGDHPDGKAWQVETLAFMALQEEKKFHLSVNIHGGEEVCNYPWDNKTALSADNAWWYYVCKEYADTARAYSVGSSPRYMNYGGSGVVRGCVWYMIDGGRQDYANYYDHCREFCLEISTSKTPTASKLPTYWDWNYRSFLNYIEQALYGIHGTTTDGATGLPVHCSVVIQSHDHTNSHVYSNATTGYYARPIKAGTYTITYTALGYDVEIRTITIADKQKVIQDIQFNYSGMTAAFTANKTDISTGNQVAFTNESFSINPITDYSWTFEGGTPSTSTQENPTVTYNSTGTFDVSLTINDGTGTKTITKEDYISVSVHHVMQNTTIQACEGYFFDSGGVTGSYSNNENYTMTIKPDAANSLTKITFLEFDVESHSSCNYDYLNVYDGPNASSPLLGKFCGSTLPGPFTSTAADGSLTFVFQSDYSQTGAGWKALVECIPIPMVPIANFSSNTTTIIEGQQVQFNDISENYPTSWAWTFEGVDPSTSNEQNPIVTYSTEGNYGVTLTVTNTEGTDTKHIDGYITVSPYIATPPIAQFSANQTLIIANSVIEFTDISENNPTSWEWTFEGGTPSTSTEQNPSITYIDSGNFDVSLKVTNADGEDIITKPNYINVALSINQIDSSINIYPNPAKDAIYIESQSLITKIELMDLSGRNISLQQIKQNSVIIDIKDVAPGLYLINVHSENTIYRSKIIISK